MRGLHNIRLPSATSTWRWYASYVSRRGRRHIFKVPTEEIDLNAYLTAARRLPYNLRYSSDEARRNWANNPNQGNNLCFPNYLINDTPHAERFCNNEQAAVEYRWDNTPRRDIDRPRGYCDTCWREYERLQGTFAETLRAQPVSRLSGSLDEWRASAQRFYQPR